MKLQYKPDFDRAKTYWRAYWQGEVLDRPIVCVKSPKDGVPRAKWPRYMIGSDGNFQEAVETWDAFAASIYYGGEAIPFFEPTFGPDQFAAFTGAELEFGWEAGTSWAKPYVKDWSSVELKLVEGEGSAFKRMLDFMEYCSRYSEGKFLLSVHDLHSNMDCLSAIRGPENLCMDLMDCPDDVEKALNAVRKMYQPVYEKLFKAGRMDERGSLGWAPFYTEGRFAVLQCDFICMISPAQARRFVIPAIEEEAAYLDRCVYHYDGPAALVHLDDILAIKDIDVIQWVPGAGQPPTYEWMDLLKKIQKAGKGLWLYDWPVDVIKARYRELDPKGLVFDLSVNSEKEAEDLLTWFKKNT